MGKKELPSLLTFLLGNNRPFEYMLICGWTGFVLSCIGIGLYYVAGRQDFYYLNILIPFVTVILCIFLKRKLNETKTEEETIFGHFDRICSMELAFLCLASIAAIITYLLYHKTSNISIFACLLLIPSFKTTIFGCLRKDNGLLRCGELGMTIAVISLSIMGENHSIPEMEFVVMISFIVNMIFPGYLGIEGKKMRL